MNAEELTPLVKKVRFALSPIDVFDRFTREIHTWWPLGERFCVGKENCATVVFGAAEREDIVEHFKDGGKTVWGTVLIWKPPTALRFTWHPGSERNANMIVHVNFVPIEGGTEVELTHTGWENMGENAPAIRTGYDGGWDTVLSRLVDLD